MAEIEDLKIVGGSTYTVGNQDIIANEWEAGVTYVKGKSYVIREHRLYVCNVTHTSVEPFDTTKWMEITVGEAIAANTTAIGSLSTLTTTDKSSIVGAVNEVNRAVTPQTITITPNTTVATGFDYKVVKVGKLVTYFLSCQLSTSIATTGTVIASDFPKAVSNIQIPVTAVSGANAGQTNQMAIMTDGKLQTRYTSTATFPNGAYMLASGCYITSE